MFSLDVKKKGDGCLTTDQLDRFHCYKCVRSYGTKGALQRHIKYECQNVRLFPCPICGKTFKRSCHVKNHVKIVHYVDPVIAPSYPEKSPSLSSPSRFNRSVYFKSNSELKTDIVPIDLQFSHENMH